MHANPPADASSVGVLLYVAAQGLHSLASHALALVINLDLHVKTLFNADTHCLAAPTAICIGKGSDMQKSCIAYEKSVPPAGYSSGTHPLVLSPGPSPGM